MWIMKTGMASELSKICVEIMLEIGKIGLLHLENNTKGIIEKTKLCYLATP